VIDRLIALEAGEDDGPSRVTNGRGSAYVQVRPGQGDETVSKVAWRALTYIWARSRDDKNK